MTTNRIFLFFKKRPRWIFVFIYLVFIIISLFYSLFCESGFCKVWFVMASMPWPPILGEMGGSDNEVLKSSIYYLVILGVVLNVCITYLFGLMVEKLFSKK